MNFANYSFNVDYFLFNVDDVENIHPRQQLDHNRVEEDKVVVFPRRIYSGEPFPEPMKRGDPIDGNTVYYAEPGYTHPYYTTKFGKYPICPFGYCNGPQSGRDYMCGVFV